MSSSKKMRCKFSNQQVVGDARDLVRFGTLVGCKKCDIVESGKMLITQDFKNTRARHHHKQYHDPNSKSATQPASRGRQAFTMSSSRALASFQTIVKVFILSYLAVMFVGYFKTNENGDINFDGERAGRFLFVQAGSKSSKGSSKTTVIAIDGGGGGGKPHPVPVPWPVVHCHHHHHHMKYVPKPVLVHHWVKKVKPSFEMDATSMDQHVVNLPINLQGAASDPALPGLMNEEFQPTIVRPDTILPQQELIAGGKLVASLNSVFDDHANRLPPAQFRPSSSFMKQLPPVNRNQVDRELKKLQWQQHQQELKRKNNNGPKFNQTKLINKLTHSILESNSKIPFGIDGDSSQKSIVLASNSTGSSAELLSGNKPVVATAEDNWINLSEQKQPAYELSSSSSSLEISNQPMMDSLSSEGSQTKHLLDNNLNHDAQQHHEAASVDFLTELGKANAREESEAARMFAHMSLEQTNRMQSVLNTGPQGQHLVGSPSAVYFSPPMQPPMMQSLPVLANTGISQQYAPNLNPAAPIPLPGSASSESRAILTMTKLAESIAQAEANKLLKKQIKHQKQASANDTSTAKPKHRESNPLRMFKLLSLFASPGISNNKDKRRAASPSFIDTLNYATGDVAYPNRRFVHTWPNRDRAHLLNGYSLARKPLPATMNHIVAIPSLPKQLRRVTQRDDRPLSQIVNDASSRIYQGMGRYPANDMLAQSSNRAAKVTVRVDREVSDKKDQDTKRRSKTAPAKLNTAKGTVDSLKAPKVAPDGSSKSSDSPVVTPTTMNPEQEISFYNGQQDHLKKLKQPADQLNTPEPLKRPESPAKLYNIESSNVHNSIVEPSMQNMSPLLAPTRDESSMYNTITGEPMQSWLEHQLLYTKQMQPIEQYNKLPEEQTMQPNQLYQQQPVADQLTVPASSSGATSYLEFPMTPQQWSAEALKSINDVNYQDSSIGEEQGDVQVNGIPTNSAEKEATQSDSKDSPSIESYNSNSDNKNQFYQTEHKSPAMMAYDGAILPLSSSSKFKSENMSEWEKYFATKLPSQLTSSQSQELPLSSWQNDQQIMMYSQQNPHFSQLNQPVGYQALPASSYELRPPNYSNLVQMDPYYHGQYSSPLASYGTAQFANPFMSGAHMASPSSPSLMLPNSTIKWGHGGNMANLTTAASNSPLMSTQYNGFTKAGKFKGGAAGFMQGINQLPDSGAFGSLNSGIGSGVSQQPAFSGVETLDTATNEMNGLRQFHDSISQGVNQADNVTTMARLSQQLRDQMRTLQARLPSMPNIPQPPQIPNLPMPPPGMMQMAGLALPFAMARANRIRNQQVNGAAAGGGSTAGQRLFQSAATITNRIVRPRRRPTRSPSSRPGGSVSTPPARGSTRRGLFGVLRNLADLNRRPPMSALSASGSNGAGNGHRQSSILSGGPKIKPKVDRVSYGKSMDRSRFVSKWHQWINEAGSPGQIPLTLNDGSMRSFSSMTSPMDMLANQINSRLAQHQQNERLRARKERFELSPVNEQREYPQLVSDADLINKTLGYSHTPAFEPTKTTGAKYELIMPHGLAYGQAKSSADIQHGPLVPLPLVSNYINLLMVAAQNVTQGGDSPAKPTTTTTTTINSNQEMEVATTQPTIEVVAIGSERPIDQTNELPMEISGGQQPSLQVLNDGEQPISDSQRIQPSAETTTPTTVPVGEVRHTRSTSEAPKNNQVDDGRLEEDEERMATASSADYVRAIKLVRGVAYPWPPPTKSSKMLDEWQSD